MSKLLGKGSNYQLNFHIKPISSSSSSAGINDYNSCLDIRHINNNNKSNLLTTSVPPCEPVLWIILLDSLLDEDFTRPVSAVMRNLAVLSQQRLDSSTLT